MDNAVFTADINFNKFSGTFDWNEWYIPTQENNNYEK